jgi:TPR repeat protein
MKLVALSIILALNFVAPVSAGPLEDGNAAYSRHDYATAMRILRPLAESGDGMAETIVGMMYFNNFGVPLDYATAHMWFSRSASHATRQADAEIRMVLRRLAIAIG